jgi:hypothetical protein
MTSSEVLIRSHAVHGDGGVVAGDDALLGDVEHLFLHVEAPADAVDVGDQEVQAGVERADIGAEALDGPDLALRHGFGAGEDGDDHQQQHEHPDDEIGVLHHGLPFR